MYLIQHGLIFGKTAYKLHLKEIVRCVMVVLVYRVAILHGQTDVRIVLALKEFTIVGQVTVTHGD